MLVTDLRPLQWPALAVDALDSIRTSLEKLKPQVAGEGEGREALREIADEINGLARMIDEMLDVENVGRRSR
jgi:signal transduction histidine kinase